MELQRKPRPKFGPWRYDHNLNLRRTAELIEQAGRELGFARFTCSDETVRRICMPFDAPERRSPGPRLVAAIAHLTKGAVTEHDWRAPVSDLAA